MRAGEFADGAHVLRAKIDMASPNINMRDPVLYRIRRAHHHRTGDAWCIYPMYDYAHPLVGRDRAHHALALHARVRGSPAALRLADRQPAGAGHAAADRVRAAEPHLHGDEQAQAAAARAGKARQRLGRSAHADARRHAAARLHAGGDPRVLRAHRRRQARERHRRRAARVLRARGSQPARAARRWPCCARCASSSRTIPKGTIEEMDVVNNPEDPSAGTRKVPFSRVLYIEQRRLPRGSAEEVLPPRAGPRGAAALRLLHHLHRRREGRRPARSSSCAARTIRRRAAATRPTAAR